MKLLKPYSDAQVLRLTRVLETPSLNHSSEQAYGWINLTKFGADWSLTARQTINAITGEHHVKAIYLVYRIGQLVMQAHGWYDGEFLPLGSSAAPFSQPKSLAPLNEYQYPKKLREIIRKPEWRGERERLARKYQEQIIGDYCLSHAIRLGVCSTGWSDHKDYKCKVILLPGDSPLRRQPSDYTQAIPFERWTSQVDARGHTLVKTDLGTKWTPDDWHFTGRPLLANEDRLWHPFQYYERRVGRRPRDSWEETASLANTRYGKVGTPPDWLEAIHKHEAVPFRINGEILKLLKDLDYKEPELTQNPYRVVDHATGLAEYNQFYQRLFVDKRGRMFSSRSDIQYQGDDPMRCLLEFAEGKEVGNEGYEYLLFHAANLYEAPATTVKEKIAYGREHLEQFIEWAENAVGTQNEWAINAEGAEIDDKYLFIRACMELRDATNKKSLKPKKGFISHLPVEVDQTNSVIQHLALFYGHKDTALISNLLRLGDLYTLIAQDWEISGLTDHQKRKVIKKIVVPRCYGSGPETITIEQLMPLPMLKDWTPDGEPRRGRSSKQDAIAAARQAGYSEKEATSEIERLRNPPSQRWSYKKIAYYMELVALAQEGIDRVEALVPVIRQFRLEIGRLLTRETKAGNLPSTTGEVAWPTISGFEVHIRPVGTELDRSIKLPKSQAEPHVKVQINAHYPNPYLDRKKLATGLQAHIVHSTDAALAHLLVANSEYPVIAVHDAFATHACNVADLRLDFVYNLFLVHLAGRPYDYFRYYFGGEPVADGVTADDWHEPNKEMVRMLTELRGSSFFEMIS